jgi:hypothetical protein
MLDFVTNFGEVSNILEHFQERYLRFCDKLHTSIPCFETFLGKVSKVL